MHGLSRQHAASVGCGDRTVCGESVCLQESGRTSSLAWGQGSRREPEKGRERVWGRGLVTHNQVSEPRRLIAVHFLPQPSGRPWSQSCWASPSADPEPSAENSATGPHCNLFNPVACSHSTSVGQPLCCNRVSGPGHNFYLPGAHS